MSRPRFYVTTAISYVNGAPHLGHAYEAISTDVIARFKRLDGHDVRFLTGTDEHGQKVQKTARAQGKDPMAFCDEIAGLFQGMVERLAISNDDFIRTTQPRHTKSVQALWRKLREAGDIYLGGYSGWYSVRDEAFFTEEETIVGPDGKRRSVSTGTEVEWVEEPSYFFRLSAYTDRLLAHYAAHPEFIQPDYRRNEIVNFVKQGLTDLSVSRTSFDWGIPVPDDDKHVMYVWLDALTNYITAIGYPDDASDMFTRFWPADLHVIGKDILRFHTVYWPAFLMSAGLPLPKTVFGHGFLTVNGEKMSKSLGNIITPDALVSEYGLDQTRYFLMREVPYGNDGSISPEAIQMRVNADLANDYGNLAQRVLSMIAKNLGGTVPEPGAFTAEDEALLSQAEALLPNLRAEMDRFAIHKTLEAIWRVVSEANRYVDAQAPWALRKTDPARMATVLYVLADVIRRLAILTQPVMPSSSAKILDLLAVPQDAREFAHLSAHLSPGVILPAPSPVFPRWQPKSDADGEPEGPRG